MAKTCTMEVFDADTDLMKALSQIPPMQLSSIDGAFGLLDSGLGAIFSARAARGADALHWRAASQPPRSSGSGSPIVWDSESSTASTESPDTARGRGAALLKQAVTCFRTPRRRLAAQKATMAMVEVFVDETRVKASGSRRRSASIKEEDEPDDTKSPEPCQANEVPSSAAPLYYIPEDPSFKDWAAEWLQLQPDRLKGLEGQAKLGEKLRHQKLCWQALRISKLPLPGTARGPREPGGAVGDATTPTSVLASTAQSMISPRSTPSPRARQAKTAQLPVVPAPVEQRSTAPELRLGLGAKHSWRHLVRDDVAVGAARRRSSFVEPHCDVMSNSMSCTPEFAYLRRCELAGLVPCQAAWRHFGGDNGVVNAHKRGLNDADIGAIVETVVQCAAEGHAVRSLDLGGNSLTDAGLGLVASLLLGPPATCGGLTSLNLAWNSLLRMRSEAALRQFGKALEHLPSLGSLDLSGVQLQSKAAVRLVESLDKCWSLKSLSLAACGLGHRDQADCVAVASLLGCRAGGRPGLEHADLSGNFFGRAGFAAAAAELRHSRLRTLSLSGNGGIFASEVRPDGKEYQPRFHPLQLFIEGLQANTALRQLDLSSCGLGPDTAFVLEDSLRAHPAIQSLDLSDNPLGDAGLRCILRLLLSIKAEVQQCIVGGHREADALANPIRFRFAQPGGVYRLNLRYPHERAVLRTLLRYGGKARGSTFRFFKFDAKQQKPAVEKDPDTDGWVVPAQGACNFTFQPPLSEAANKFSTQAAASERSRQSGRNSVIAVDGSGGPAAMALMRPIPGGGGGERQSYGYCRDPRRMYFQDTLHAPSYPSSAVSSAESRGSLNSSRGSHLHRGRLPRGTLKVVDHVVDISEVGQRASGDQADWREISMLIKGARIKVSALRYPLIRAMFLSLVTQDQQLRFVRACSKDICFNCAQVSRLCDDRPEISAQTVCSLLPSVRGRSAQLLLLSDVKASSVPAVSKAVGPFLWFQEGNLTGKYHLDLAEPAEYAVAENCLLVNAWEVEVGRLLGHPDVSQRGNYEMLRNEAHNEVRFAYSRDWSLPSHGLLRFDYSSCRRPPPTAAAMPEASEVTRCFHSGDATEDGEGDSGPELRALRAISVHLFLSAQQFRQLILCFPPGGARQDFFCILHTRVVDPARLLSADVLYSDQIFSDEDRRALFARIGHLHLLNPLHPDGVKFTCNLSIHEERMVADFLVQLSAKEPGGRVVFASPGDKEGVAVPASWTDKGVPCNDVAFTFSYDTANPNTQWRLSLVDRYCIGQFVGADRSL